MRNRGRAMQSLLVFHRWLALLVGLVLIVTSVSGALLVLEQPIATAGLPRVTPGAGMVSLDSMAAAALASAGGGTVVSASFGTMPDDPYVVAVAQPSALKSVMLDPYTGRTIGALPPPSWAQRTMRSVHQFHTRLLADNTGSVIVDFVTLSSLLLVITGLVIWFQDRRWRIQWSASWKRIVFDLHHALGVFAAIVLLLITATGVWMGYPAQIDPLVMKLNRTPVPLGQPDQPSADPGATPVGLDSLVRVARAIVPGAPVLAVRTPPKGPVLVTLRYPEDHTPGGRSRVWIDRYRGTVLRSQNTRAMETGSRLLALQRALHTGDILGAAGSVIWFLAALILGSQAVTGVLMWWNGGRKVIA
jgi:uncharacterized iron-regulated membrane protein